VQLLSQRNYRICNLRGDSPIQLRRGVLRGGQRFRIIQII
jgi:hypothetical protein